METKMLHCSLNGDIFWAKAEYINNTTSAVGIIGYDTGL